MAELKQRMTMHLNGGSEFSQLHYEVLADGKPTGITRVTITDGSPRYKKTKDEFISGDESFDVMETKGVGLKEWLEQQMKRAKS
jgi:hypothetical protein